MTEAPPSALHDTNRKNLLLLVQLRWLAVGGQVATILFVHYGLEIGLALPSMMAVVLFLVGLNIATLLHLRRPRRVSNIEIFCELLFDVTALTIQLYLSGGATNPFITLYLLQVTLGAVLLESWSVWMLALACSVCFIGLIASYRPMVVSPHEHGADLFALHIQGMFLCFVLAAGLIVLFITRIGRNLRERDAHLADLRRQSVEEDHIVRMGLLASGAAHELGTPLATLAVILSDWRRMPQLSGDPEIAPEIEEMQAQLDRCKTIVSGILMSAGQARGEGTVRTTVNAFLEEAMAEWCAARSPARLDYRNGFGPDAIVLSDPALKQVVFNLFDNALEASPNWVGVAAERRDQALTLTVSDAGPGFDPGILEEFGKPYRSSKNRPGGGLGLFLVVNVVRKLGGTVTARNLPGQGACVTLALPLSALSPGGGHGE